MEMTRTPITILYASETGNAEELAYSLHNEICKDARYDASIHSINNITNQELDIYKFVIFIVSTAGDGEAPTSMKSIWSFLLRKSIPTEWLNGTKFAVFGLGDSSYEKFNATARKLFVRLQQIGAKTMTDLGLGDDQDKYGYYSAFNPWKKKLFEALQIDLTNSSVMTNLLVTSYTVSTDSQLLIKSTPKGKFLTKAVINQRLTHSVWGQDVRLIGLEIIPELSQANTTGELSDSSTLYQPGDVAVVHFRNSKDIVDRALSLFTKFHPSIHPDSSLLTIRNSPTFQRKSRIVGELQCSLRSLFRDHLDIAGIPHRNYFTVLSHFATDEEEQSKLRELGAPEGTDLYFDYCLREKRNYIEIIEEFHSVQNIPLEAFIAMIPKIPPREYSIASSPLKHPLRVELCVAVATYRTPYGRQRKGLCSSFLASLSLDTDSSASDVEDNTVYIDLKAGTIRESQLSAAFIHQRPYILVGPGTGVAPMRSIIEHAYYLKSNVTGVNVNNNSITLFFGNRKRERDYLFEDEWQRYTSNAVTEHNLLFQLQVTTAFSQDQMIKEYVQHKMRESNNAKRIYQAIQNNGVIFIAGSANRMPQDVKAAFIDILVQEGGMDKSQAEQQIALLVRTKRYIVEAWS